LNLHAEATTLFLLASPDFDNAVPDDGSEERAKPGTVLHQEQQFRQGREGNDRPSEKRLRK
jgi:hypothetical protein